MCQSMVNIQSPTIEIRRGKNEEEEERNSMKILWYALLHRATITTIPSQMQMRNKPRIGTWNICSMLQLGKVQLLGEEMMRLGVDICEDVRGEMGWTRTLYNTGWPHNSILRSTYSGPVRSGSLDS